MTIEYITIADHDPENEKLDNSDWWISLHTKRFTKNLLRDSNYNNNSRYYPHILAFVWCNSATTCLMIVKDERGKTPESK